MAYETGTITGTFTHPDGTAHHGSVRVTPSVPVMRDQAGDVIMSGSMAVELDETGAFTITLPASDDAALDPTGVTYALQARLTGAASQRFTGVFVTTDGTVDLADLGSLDPAAPSYQEWVNAAETAAGQAEAAQAVAEAEATEAAGHATAAAGSAAAAASSAADAETAVTGVATAVDEAVEQAIEDHTPGISLGYAERPTSHTPTSGGTIPSLTVIVVGQGRPVDIEAQVTKGYHSAASAPLTFALQSGAVSIASDEGNSYSTTTGKSFRAKRSNMVLVDGVTYTFTILVAHGLAGTMTWFADANRPMSISVVSR